MQWSHGSGKAGTLLDGLSPSLVRHSPPAQGCGLVQRLWRLAVLPAALVAVAMPLALGLLHDWQLQRLGTAVEERTALALAQSLPSAMQVRDLEAVRRITTTLADPSRHRVRILDRDGSALPGLDRPATSKEVVRRISAPIVDAGGVTLGWVQLEAMAPGLDTMRGASLLATLLLGLLGLGIAFHVGRRITQGIARPMVELAGAMTRFDARGPMRPVPVNGEGEIRQLQEGFNANAVALLHVNRDMQRQIEQATLELERRNAALELANKGRTRFLAAASHDLRQPLSALTLFASALVMGEKDPVRLARIHHIQECVGSLDHLFNALLDLSRLEAGAMQPCLGEFALDGLFDEVSRTFRMGAEQRGLRLIVRKTDAWVRCDRVMLSRILNNLVSNAVRYTTDGGVLIAARARGNRIRIDVWDTGNGIPEALQERVFEEFFQADTQAPMPERHGLGLGLSTVRLLCNLLELPLALKSREGRGSLFSVELAATAGLRQRLRPALVESPLDVTGMRVLVIDDEPSILEGLRIVMEAWGCEVATAADGDAAMRIAQAWQRAPDIVVSDLQLGSGRSGLDAMNALQAHFHGRGLGQFPCLLITGETSNERLREIQAARVPVLYKPVTPEQLREAMVAVLAIQRAA